MSNTSESESNHENEVSTDFMSFVFEHSRPANKEQELQGELKRFSSYTVNSANYSVSLEDGTSARIDEVRFQVYHRDEDSEQDTYAIKLLFEDKCEYSIYYPEVTIVERPPFLISQGEPGEFEIPPDIDSEILTKNLIYNLRSLEATGRLELNNLE